MSQSQQLSWHQEYGDYISGALFGLITLDVFMLLIHGMVERSVSDYGFGTLSITVPIMLVWVFERMYTREAH